MCSEQILGLGGPDITDPSIVDVRYVYGQMSVNADVSDDVCRSLTTWKTDRGARWADGEAQYAEYDHHYPPKRYHGHIIGVLAGWAASGCAHCFRGFFK